VGRTFSMRQLICIALVIAAIIAPVAAYAELTAGEFLQLLKDPENSHFLITYLNVTAQVRVTG